MCCWSVGSEIISLPAQMCDVRSLRNNNASSNCSTDILKYVIKLQPLDQFMKFSLLLSSLENCMNPESLFLIFLVQKHQDNLIVIFFYRAFFEDTAFGVHIRYTASSDPTDLEFRFFFPQSQVFN